MNRINIPRMDLVPFTEDTFSVPVFQVNYYPLDSVYFIVGDKELFPVNDYISPNRRNFYKIFHMTAGTGYLTVGLNRYEINPGSIGFLHPNEIMSWQSTSIESEGHFCIIHPKYFEGDADHVKNLFDKFPFFNANQAVVSLNSEQTKKIDNSFRRMLHEDQQNNEDKKSAILLHLQMILLETQRAVKTKVGTEILDQFNYIYKFLALLESNFQLQENGMTVAYKTANEFADQLNLHPNYLNSLVKQQTGKTVRDHIQEKILYEAKSLLLHTDWDINSIGYGLGFSDVAAFTFFFKKREKIPPSVYRKKILENAINGKDFF